MGRAPKRADWMGYFAVAVVDFGMSPQDFWDSTPQEFWACWSLKYGRRKTGAIQDPDEIKGMRRYLDEQIQKEREAGLRD